MTQFRYLSCALALLGLFGLIAFAVFLTHDPNCLFALLFVIPIASYFCVENGSENTTDNDD